MCRVWQKGLALLVAPSAVCHSKCVQSCFPFFHLGRSFVCDPSPVQMNPCHCTPAAHRYPCLVLHRCVSVGLAWCIPMADGRMGRWAAGRVNVCAASQHRTTVRAWCFPDVYIVGLAWCIPIADECIAASQQCITVRACCITDV